MLLRASSLELKRTSYGANLFGKGEALAFYGWSKNLQTHLIEDIYSYYKMIKQALNFNIVDLEEVDFGTKRHLVALTGNNQIRFYISLKESGFLERGPLRALY